MTYLDSYDVERFITWARTYFGERLISLKPIRDRQSPDLTARLQQQALATLETTGGFSIRGNSFFVGSVDFMVSRDNGDHRLFILESNGGSSRGFAILPDEQWRQAYDSYLETLNQIENDRPLVLITHPTKDLLLYEKAFLAESFAQRLSARGPQCRVVPAGELDAQTTLPAVVIGGYAQLLPRLELIGEHVCLDGVPVDILIGDGLVRRDAEISAHLLEGSLETLVVNEIFHITDDKSLTYQAVQQATDQLERFQVSPIRSWRAHDVEELEARVLDALDVLPEVVVKPHGGSGGAGIDLIADIQQVRPQINASIDHYHEKFGPNRNPFPYTVSQRVEATPAVWRDSPRQYDIRIYVGRQGDSVMPLGALARIALEPFLGQFTRKTFVVNLSGYGGVDTDRGLGLSPESLEVLGLTEDDFHNMFCAGATLLAYIGRHFDELRGFLLQQEMGQHD